MKFLNKTLLLMILLTMGCAVQAPPSGGPVDRTPPEIVSVSLLPGSIHVPVDLKEIEVIFSERMKEGSERNNLFVSPPVEFVHNWRKGKILKIEFLQELKAEQTYVFTIGRGLQDLRNNKMAQSFALAFSTGDTIDQGRISGKVYGLKPNETFNIFAYLLSDSSAFNPFDQRPDYISQSGEEGRFTLGYLRNGCYRIIAVNDRNHNLLLDAALERFALGYTDVCLDSARHDVSGFELQPAGFDTVAPQIISVRALFNDFVRVRFSEPLWFDSAFTCTLQDSATLQAFPVLDFGRNPENKNWLEILTQPLDSGKTYLVRFSHLQDSSGNRQSKNLSLFFKSFAKEDTSKFRLLTFSPADSARKVRPESEIYLKFSHPINRKTLIENFNLTLKSGAKVEGAWHFASLYEGAFKPAGFLQPDSQYMVHLDLAKVRDFRGRPPVDSLPFFVFTVISQKELGEVSGAINIVNPQRPVVLRLRSLGRQNLMLTRTIRNRNAFKFSFVPEGQYLLSGFIDLNENKKFDRGRLNPFRFCEPFAYSTDTIRVRKRWETAGIKFNLPEARK